MENNVQQPCIPKECENPYHMYYLLLPDGQQRNEFVQAMHQKGNHVCLSLPAPSPLSDGY
jgi:hypothetical protein